MNETNSLNLVDMDDVELLEALETAFDVQFVRSEVGELRTVGELFDLLQAKVGTTPGRRRRCLTAACFYRLKKATLEISGTAITPRMAVDEVFPARSLPSLMASLGERAGLRLRPVAPALEQVLVFLLGLSSCIAAFSFGLTSLAGIVALLIGLGFFAILRFARFPRSMGQCSFGDLAREASYFNYGRLARDTGTRNSLDLWKALDFMIRHNTGFDGRIDRETRFV